MFVYQIIKYRFEVFFLILIICNPLTRCTKSPCSFSFKLFAFAINLLTSPRSLRLLSRPILRFSTEIEIFLSVVCLLPFCYVQLGEYSQVLCKLLSSFFLLLSSFSSLFCFSDASIIISFSGLTFGCWATSHSFCLADSRLLVLLQNCRSRSSCGLDSLLFCPDRSVVYPVLGFCQFQLNFQLRCAGTATADDFWMTHVTVDLVRHVYACCTKMFMTFITLHYFIIDVTFGFIAHFTLQSVHFTHRFSIFTSSFWFWRHINLILSGRSKTRKSQEAT